MNQRKTLIRLQTDEARPLGATLSDFNMTNRSRDSQFAVQLFRSLHRESVKLEFTVDATIKKAQG